MINDKTVDKRAQRKEVIQREQEWHEQELEARGSRLDFLYAPPAFDAIIKESLDFLAAPEGTMILDLACGEGKESQIFAAEEFAVISLDLSIVQLQRTRQRIKSEAGGDSSAVMFVQANAEELPFKAGSLDRLYGKAIIHHLDLELAHEEITRVLGDDGRVVLTEPMAHHPLFWLARQLTPRYRTQDERPMVYNELVAYANQFDRAQIKEAFLLAPFIAPLRKLPRGEKLYAALITPFHRLDSWLLKIFPFLKRYAWYDTVFIKK